MYVDHNKGLIIINDKIQIDIRTYCEDCYNHNPETVNKGLIDLIKHTDNKYKLDIGYIPVSNDQIAATMTILSECWKLNKDKMNLIMDDNIITFKKDK